MNKIKTISNYNNNGFLTKSSIPNGMTEDSRADIQIKHDYLKNYLLQLSKLIEIPNGNNYKKRMETEKMYTEVSLIIRQVERLNNLLLC